jgi:thymidylate kinase
VLENAANLFERLDETAIPYCHWKSNRGLDAGVQGATDLDLLVERRQADAFRDVLHELGFRPASEGATRPLPAVEHYHALDPSGSLVHVHAYYRIITGDSLGKSYHLPLEAMLLENTRRVGLVTVPSEGAELIVFTLRMHIKHTSLVELALLHRDWAHVRREADGLAGREARREAAVLLSTWLPQVDGTLFASAVDALVKPMPLAQRVVIARQIRAQLQPFARYGRVRASMIRTQKVMEAGVARLHGSRRRLVPANGGAVIAFVGAEATGKSTIIQDVEQWLDPHYVVRRVHAGKPPGTVLTALPNLLLPALRALLPEQRSTSVMRKRIDVEPRGRAGRSPLLFALRSVSLAHDRRALLTHAFAAAANGSIVLCDRYPSLDADALDGSQLAAEVDAWDAGTVRRWLARLEARLYRDVPAADLVIRLTAPLEVTLERNRSREKREGDEYVLARRERSLRQTFGRARVVDVDTDRPLHEAKAEVRQVVWESL